MQNKVYEVWAAFDFLMPNFLGSSAAFSKLYARPITKSQSPNASPSIIHEGMEKLKLLHQQVLPFLLRRDKSEVLQDLPPKTTTTISVPLSTIQRYLYVEFCRTTQARESIAALERADADISESVGAAALKSILFLRLLCTHPSLVYPSRGRETDDQDSELYTLQASGKLVALHQLLCETGLADDSTMAADNDTSLIYFDDQPGRLMEDDEALALSTEQGTLSQAQTRCSNQSQARCLIFAQFTKSLDVIEEYIMNQKMPNLRYLRLDGKVPAPERADIADRFNRDSSIAVLLLTTRVGGLGLNLTGADTVILLESDFNPFADLQVSSIVGSVILNTI